MCTFFSYKSSITDSRKESKQNSPLVDLLDISEIDNWMGYLGKGFSDIEIIFLLLFV